jgi:hydrogenase maturation protease
MAAFSTRCVVADILVIGYGNELRGDDGIGPHVAAAIAAANYPGVRVMTCCQLVPELAEDLRNVRLALFVDAASGPQRVGVELRRITAGDTTDWSTHSGDPRALLALTHALYGRPPEAWWVTVSGEHFGFGEGLSAFAEENAHKAIDSIEVLIDKFRAGGIQPEQSVPALPSS